MALFCGGLVQLLAGMWEFPRGNVFGGAGKTRTPKFLCYPLSYLDVGWVGQSVTSRSRTGDLMSSGSEHHYHHHHQPPARPVKILGIPNIKFMLVLPSSY